MELMDSVRTSTAAAERCVQNSPQALSKERRPGVQGAGLPLTLQNRTLGGPGG